MKTKKKLLFILFVAALTLPFLSNAQNLSFREEPKPDTPKTGWQPIKLDDKGVNLKDGVEFYFKKGDCPYGIIALLKFINKNTYSVNVSYQINAESPVVEIMLPASKTLEGSCEIVGGDLSKLRIKLPEAKEEQQKMKQYSIAHIFVVKN